MDRQPPLAQRRAAQRALTALEELNVQQRATLAEMQRELKKLTKSIEEIQSKTKTADKNYKLVRSLL